MSSTNPSQRFFRPSAAQSGLVGANLLIWGGFFAVIPLVTVHFIGDLRWAAVSVGLVLAVRQLTQQSVTVFGGMWSDQIGPKPLILMGCVLRMIGFTWLGFAPSLATLMAASVVAGIGGGIFEAPKDAALTAVTRPEDRAQMFSLMGMSGNIGMVAGPLIGAAMIGLGFRTAAIASGGVYLLVALVMGVTLPHVRPTSSVGAGGIDNLRAAALDTHFRRFTLVLVGYFILSTQINVSITLRALELAGKGATGPLYGLSAGLAVFLQYPLIQVVERHVRARAALVMAVLLVAAALGLMAFAQSFMALLACVALYSLGTMIVFPTQQTLTARFAPPALIGSYFGFGAISLGVGGAIGNVIGGLLIDAGQRMGFSALPWFTLLTVGVITAAGLWWALKSLPFMEPTLERKGEG